MDFIQRCRTLIGIDSTPSAGNWEAAQFVKSYAEKLGFKVEALPETHQGREELNLIIRPSQAPTGAEEFMLQTHLDTSDPGPYALWSSLGGNPFNATIVDKCIYGLGTADCKLDILCKLDALAHWATHSNFKRTPIIVATYGEEQGMPGALKLIRKQKIKAKHALIGEPSNLSIIYGGKGLANFEIRIPYTPEEASLKENHNFKEGSSSHSKMFRGKAAHSSNPKGGDSAILKMLSFLSELPDGVLTLDIEGGVNFNTVPAVSFFEFVEEPTLQGSVVQRLRSFYSELLDIEAEFSKFIDREFEPPHPTFNLGTIKTHDTFVQISGSCRIPAMISQGTYEGWTVRLQKFCQSIGSDFKINDYKKPFRTPTDSDLAQVCLTSLLDLKLPPVTITQPTTNEASLFSRVGIQCLGFGPGKRDDNIHTPREHVAIQDLQNATDFYRGVIERFCL